MPKIPQEIIEELIDLAGQVEDLMNWNRPYGKVMNDVRKIYKKYPREMFVQLADTNEDLEQALMFV